MAEEEQGDLAKMKAQVYKDPRPKEYFDRFHERSRTREPDAVYEVVRSLATIVGFLVFRARCIGANNVPASGPVIVAPNHFSFMDHFFLGTFIRRKLRFMGKSQMFKSPWQWIYTHGGVFPVRRGYQDEEAFITARTILERGACLGMYCEGGRSRTGKVGERAKAGIGRLALESGAPIVPVAICSAKVRNWKRLQFPNVVVRYGEPMQFAREENSSHERQQQVADQILDEIRRLYMELEELGSREVRRRLRAEQS